MLQDRQQMTASTYVNTSVPNTYYQMPYPQAGQPQVVYRYNTYQQVQQPQQQQVQQLPAQQAVYYSDANSNGYISNYPQQGNTTPTASMSGRLSQSNLTSLPNSGNANSVLTTNTGLVSSTPHYTTSTSINAMNQAHHVFPYPHTTTSPVLPALVSTSSNNSSTDPRHSYVIQQQPQPTHLTIAAIPDSQQHHSLRVLSSATTADGKGPRIITTIWEDENTLCYQVEANGVSVVRRADNDMINGTKLLNVTKMTRGKRDGILRSEKYRKVVKIGSMHLKGVWIPFERALFIAKREKIVDILYPLFVRDITSVLKNSLTPSSLVIPMQDNTTITSKIYQLPPSHPSSTGHRLSQSNPDRNQSPLSQISSAPRVEDCSPTTATTPQFSRLSSFIKKEQEARPILKSLSSSPPLIIKTEEETNSSWNSRKTSQKSDVTKISSLINA